MGVVEVEPPVDSPVHGAKGFSRPQHRSTPRCSTGVEASRQLSLDSHRSPACLWKRWRLEVEGGGEVGSPNGEGGGGRRGRGGQHRWGGELEEGEGVVGSRGGELWPERSRSKEEDKGKQQSGAGPHETRVRPAQFSAGAPAVNTYYHNRFCRETK